MSTLVISIWLPASHHSLLFGLTGFLGVPITCQIFPSLGSSSIPLSGMASFFPFFKLQYKCCLFDHRPKPKETPHPSQHPLHPVISLRALTDHNLAFLFTHLLYFLSPHLSVKSVRATRHIEGANRYLLSWWTSDWWGDALREDRGPGEHWFWSGWWRGCPGGLSMSDRRVESVRGEAWHIGRGPFWLQLTANLSSDDVDKRDLFLVFKTEEQLIYSVV